MNERGPLLICSRPFPPKLGGSSILSRNLWGAWPADDLMVLSQMNSDEVVDPNLVLKDVHIQYMSPWMPSFPRIKTLLEPLMAFQVRRHVIKLANECKPRAIWVNWPSTGFLLGAWLAAKALRIPFYVHMHDMWEGTITNHRNWMVGLAARLFQKKLLRDARKVFVITETAADEFRRLFGIESYVLKHCIPDMDLELQSEPIDLELGPCGIHFAGYVYSLMNQNAIFCLVKALDLCQSDVKFIAYILNGDVFASSGIASSRLVIRKGTKADVMAAQRKASIMYLPLAFDSISPKEIRTVFPTKLLEYFVSGRPILVHAPADSWASRSARKYGWGEVVDQPDPQLLALSIDALLKDETRQKVLVAAAYEEARRRLSSNVARDLRQELTRLEKET